MPATLKHQLLIHLDYAPTPGGLDIHYSYPFSGEHKLNEQVIRINRENIPPTLKQQLDAMVEALKARIPAPLPVRLPHAEAMPSIRTGTMTLVIQDQTRASILPVARLCYYEELEELESKIEKRFISNDRGSLSKSSTYMTRFVKP